MHTDGQYWAGTCPLPGRYRADTGPASADTGQRVNFTFLSACIAQSCVDVSTVSASILLIRPSLCVNLAPGAASLSIEHNGTGHISRRTVTPDRVQPCTHLRISDLLSIRILSSRCERLPGFDDGTNAIDKVQCRTILFYLFIW